MEKEKHILKSMTDEMWKDIIGYEDFYQISNKGYIRSKDRIVFDKNGIRLRLIKAKIIRFRLGKYKMIGLNKNRVQSMFLVHRLVAIHFIANRENKNNVNHLDGDKYNNEVSNLEWCTSSENVKHAFLTGLKKPTWLNKKLPPETLKKMSDSRKGKPAHNKGKKQPRIKTESGAREAGLI